MIWVHPADFDWRIWYHHTMVLSLFWDKALLWDSKYINA